jgi:hypothetical protein
VVCIPLNMIPTLSLMLIKSPCQYRYKQNNQETHINWFNSIKYVCLSQAKDKDIHQYIYTVRQKLSTTWFVSIISFLIMNLFQIGLLFSLPVHTYLLTCETGYWSIFIYVYMTGCVKCHVYFSTFVFANESWFFVCRVLSFIFYWCSLSASFCEVYLHVDGQ